MKDEPIYMCIDLKSFYASVECAARGLDPFTTNLAVADPDRGENTICLAITPAMKDLGIRNRCRVYEIPKDVEYIKAKPHMKHYMEISAEIYSVYLRYISADDIHVYSIDECFIYATPYLELYNKTPKELAVMIMDAIFDRTQICATAGIGTNLFLAKVALDVTAKHVEDHIGYLDEDTFKSSLWDYQPITDIWNIGPGIARRLEKYHVRTLRGVCELNEDILYREFGVNAEYLIDHAHGIEPCTIKEIHEYTPQGSSLSSGQVLPTDYTYEEALRVLREMTDMLVLDLIEKQLVTESISLSIIYARDPHASSQGQYFIGEHGKRPLGPHGSHAGGTRKLPERTNSFKKLMSYIESLYIETVDKTQAIRKIQVGFGKTLPEEFASFNLFTDYEAEDKERRMQNAILAVKGKFGNNAVLKGTSYTYKATARERNNQVGGHNA